LARCAEADWIIEVVAENLEIKRKAACSCGGGSQTGRNRYHQYFLAAFALIAEGMSEEFQQHWAGTHFFNPPRYLKLGGANSGAKTSPK